MKRTSKTAFALAAAAAALLASGCSSLCGEAPCEALVKCAACNSCKGSSECATPNSACKGHNHCKGKGWSYMTKSECLASGGRVIE
jgi:hypothetical protein